MASLRGTTRRGLNISPEPDSGKTNGQDSTRLVTVGQQPVFSLLGVHELSGFVARHLSGRHSVPKGVRDEADGGATGDPEDEIRRSELPSVFRLPTNRHYVANFCSC